MKQNKSRPNQLFARSGFSFLKTCKNQETHVKKKPLPEIYMRLSPNQTIKNS